jgi:hypothetical protein
MLVPVIPVIPGMALRKASGMAPEGADPGRTPRGVTAHVGPLTPTPRPRKPPR